MSCIKAKESIRTEILIDILTDIPIQLNGELDIRIDLYMRT